MPEPQRPLEQVEDAARSLGAEPDDAQLVRARACLADEAPEQLWQALAAAAAWAVGLEERRP